MNAIETVAIVLAAGIGVRLGRAVPKAFVEYEGRALFLHALDDVAGCGAVDSAVLVVPVGWLEEARRLIAGEAALSRTTVVAGGVTRQDSVRLGLEAVPAGARIVLCHDAARPFAGTELFDRVLEALDDPAAAGAVPVVASADTVKRVQSGVVVGTVPREEVGLAQTPQAFRVEALRDAHLAALRRGRVGTDDAMLLEEAGYSVVVVAGDPRNFKVTTQEDLEYATWLLQRPAVGPRSRGGRRG